MLERLGGCGCLDVDGGCDDLQFGLVLSGLTKLCEDGLVGGEDVELRRCSSVVDDV